MEKIVAHFQVVTPMFLGGAQPNEQAELRAPSVKGALRFWYRAIDPNYQLHEQSVFGGSDSGAGQAKFLLRIRPVLEEKVTWNSNIGINCDHPCMPKGLNEDQKNTWILNGIKYFAFPFGMGDNKKRKYIPEGRQFSTELLFRPNLEAEHKKRVIAALWLFSHLGGLGMRSRRAFGSVALTGIDPLPSGLDALCFVPSADAGDAENWLNQVRQGYQLIRDTWLPGKLTPNHSILAGGRIKVFPTKHQTWQQAMHEAGMAMQLFRQRRQPDYNDVKAHVCADNPDAAKTPVGKTVAAKKLTHAPARAAFGIPLRFQYSSLKYDIVVNGQTRTIRPGPTFLGDVDGNSVFQRNASPIHVRIVKIGEFYHVAYLQLVAPAFTTHYDERDKRKRTPYSVTSTSILDDFWNSLPPNFELPL